jgi:hypothetical protein
VPPLLRLWLMSIALGLPAAAGAQVGRVAVKPLAPGSPEEWREGKAERGACIGADRIAGAYVVDQRTLEVVMRGGARHRLKFRRACPQLSYYGGFYYSQRSAGRLCAGTDKVMGRAGGECTIAQIVPMVRANAR